MKLRLIFFVHLLLGSLPAHSEQLYTFDNVLSLQIKLHELGYFHGLVNGEYGDDTSAAISEYQRKQGIAQTGELNRATFDSLGLSGNTFGFNGTDLSSSITTQPASSSTPEPAVASTEEKEPASRQAIYKPVVVSADNEPRVVPVVVQSASDSSAPKSVSASNNRKELIAPAKTPTKDEPHDKGAQVVQRAPANQLGNFAPPVNPYWENKRYLAQATGASPERKPYQRKLVTPLLRFSTSIGGDKVFEGFAPLAGKPLTGVNAGDGISVTVGSHFAFGTSPFTLRATASVRFTSDTDGDIDASLNVVPVDLMLVYSFQRVQVGAGPTWQLNSRAKYREEGNTLVSATGEPSAGFAFDLGWRPLDVSSAHLNFRYEATKLDFSESGGRNVSANHVTIGVGWGY